jgi:hypothetical protein
MKILPVSANGYPIPAFVSRLPDGTRDFRIVDAWFREDALREELCFICAQPFTTKHRWYVTGPLAAINRNTSEPPCHLECARFSAMACPFLVKPHMRRRDLDLPPDVKPETVGIHIERNPGIVCLYSTRDCTVYRVSMGVGDYMIDLGEPESAEWLTSGRPAKRVEVMRSLASGLPLLIKECRSPIDVSALGECVDRALPLCEFAKDDTEEDAEESLRIAQQMGTDLGELLAQLRRLAD